MSLIIVSVGTSLLTNNIEEIRHSHAILRKLDELNAKPKEKEHLKKDFQDIDCVNGEFKINPRIADYYLDLYGFCQDFFKTYNDDAVLDNLLERVPPARGADALPSEISSLLFYYYMIDENRSLVPRGNLGGPKVTRIQKGINEEKDRIVLLSTDTLDALFCANILKLLIQKLTWLENLCTVEGVKVIEHFDHSTPIQFRATDAQKPLGFMNTLEAMRGYETENEVVVIRTGGYKELSAYMFLMALAFRFTSLYLFEKSTNFMFFKGELPEDSVDNLIQFSRII